MMEEIIATSGTALAIPPHPEGQFPATLIDIVDVGEVDLTYKGTTRKKHRIYLRFYCGESFEDDDGETRPLWVDDWFTLTVSKKSKLRGFVEGWFGRAFTDAELKTFNVVRLLHRAAFLQITQNVTEDRTYANIGTIMRLPEGLEAPGVPEGYVRVKDRPPRDD